MVEQIKQPHWDGHQTTMQLICQFAKEKVVALRKRNISKLFSICPIEFSYSFPVLDETRRQNNDANFAEDTKELEDKVVDANDP